jgi:hypothetical protein
MADEKISALTSAGALSGTEPLPIVQGGVTKKTTVQDVADLKATPDLQQVTDVGFTTTNKLKSDNGAGGVSALNNGTIDLTTGGATVNIDAALVTTAYIAKLPDKLTSPQTFAMLSDVTGGGDAYLANDQTFTGENTFDIPSGNDTPIIITKGGNGAGLKVTKSSGSGDAIEVAEGSVSIDDETASTIAHFDGSKRIKSLATSTYPSLTELSYVKGVTSAIQTQLNAKVPSLTQVTGGVGVASTSNTYSNGIEIPVGTFADGSMPLVRVFFEKSSANGNLIVRLYINDTNDIAGSPILIGTSATMPASARTSVVQRLLIIIKEDGSGGGTRVQQTTFAANTDISAYFTGPAATITPDWNQVGGKWIVASVQNGSASDTTTVYAIKIDL